MALLLIIPHGFGVPTHLTAHARTSHPGGSPRIKRPPEWLGGDTVPDFTLPLVDMAEMDKPVMVVTVTDMRMMSHVRAVRKRHCFIPASPQPSLGVPPRPRCLGDDGPSATVQPTVKHSTHQFLPGR